MRTRVRLAGRVPSLRLSRRSAIPLALAVGSYAVALLQRPGVAAADTKINLHVDPGRFLGDVASVWSSTGGLGHVQAGQYSGYLFPMGPFHAAGHVLGLAPWLVQRLWLGTVLALAAWGTVRLLDALLDRERGAAHLVAGALTVLNPYVVVFSDRTSITLLGYAALPWLLLAVHRGAGDPRSWRWPAAFALVFTASGGGVNAAVTGWVLLGPLLLLLCERVGSGARWSDLGRVALRTGVASVLASLWWVVPVALHARYGLNFLPFTESVGAIWSTTSLPESLRLMGYWVTYTGIGYGPKLFPYFDTQGWLLFDPLVVTATLLVPALALTGFAWTRRLRYTPFFLALVLLGLFVMMAGFPEGAPFRHAVTGAYHRIDAVQFLRTTYKAGAVTAIGLACLGGLAFGEAWWRLPHRPGARSLCALVAAVLIAVAAWPLTRGRAIDHQVAYDHVPAAWRQAARDLDRELPSRSRAFVLPGQVFPYYRWAYTQDAILPALTKRPVAVRSAVPYADLHSADLLVAMDSLVQQRRALPGQLRPLLDLLGVRSVVTGTDDDLDRSGALPPAQAAGVLSAGGLPEAGRRYGAPRPFRSDDPDAPARLDLPRVRRTDLPAARPAVRLEPRDPSALLDGGSAGLAGMSAFGPLPGGAISYAGDRSSREIRRAGERGADLVVTDTNRRRAFVASRPHQIWGPTLGPREGLSGDEALLDPVGRGTDGQTVALYRGLSRLESPTTASFAQFPEQRPFAAFDGDPRTYWLADRYLDPVNHWLELHFERPRAVPYLDVLPRREGHTDVTALEVAGRSHPVHPGWNRLRVGLRGISSLRLRIAHVAGPEERSQRGPGALAEVRVPGLRLRELIRPPVLLERALAGADLRHSSFTYLFQRDMGDDPFRRAVRPDPERSYVPKGVNQEAALVAQPWDGEQELSRVVDPPAPRRYRVDGWLTVSPEAPDHALDRLAGEHERTRFDSSSRMEGRPLHRASRAFDGDPGSAWIAQRTAGAWIRWRSPRPLTIRSLVLEHSHEDVGFPTRVRLRWPGAATPALAVSGGGRVRLPRTVTARDIRLDVLRARGPRERRAAAPDAVGIAEVRGAGVRSTPARRLSPGCPVSVRAAGRAARLRPEGSLADFESGRPLPARGCGELSLPAGRQEIDTSSGDFRIEALRLRSPRAMPATADPGGGAVVDQGRRHRGRYEGLRLAPRGPSWLVLGESYNRGWKAWCGGRSLGAPRAIDGFANGWPVGSDCREARIEFGPNRTANVSYWISAVVCLLLLVVLFLTRGRRPAPAARGAVGSLRAADRPLRVPLGRALAIGVAAAAVLGFLFAFRAGAVLGPLVAFALWRGVGARTLVLAAGATLALVVPVIYVLFPPDHPFGDISPDYAMDLIAAHWVGLATYVALGGALWRTLASRRGRTG
jgi:arabinofuranan 3-O-arabinosyltransferase